MNRYILLFALMAVVGAVSAMDSDQAEQKDHMTLAGINGKKVSIPRETAQKIPRIKRALDSDMQKMQTKEISCKCFGTAALQVVINIVERVYENAPILKKHPQFFEKTDEHPAYTPADIPQQTKRILEKQLGKQRLQQLLTSYERSTCIPHQTKRIIKKQLGKQRLQQLLTGHEQPTDIPRKTKRILERQLGKQRLRQLLISYEQPADIPHQARRILERQLGKQRLQQLLTSYEQPTDISPQTRRILEKQLGKQRLQGLLNNDEQREELRQAADFLAIDWVLGILDNLEGKSIADAIAADELSTNDIREGKLDLSNHGITDLSGMHVLGSYVLCTIQEVDLSNNHIKEVRRDDLDRLVNLTELGLSENNITHIEPGASDVLQSLRKLRLLDNNLDEATRDRIRQDFSGVEIVFEIPIPRRHKAGSGSGSCIVQ